MKNRSSAASTAHTAATICVLLLAILNTVTTIVSGFATTTAVGVGGKTGVAVTPRSTTTATTTVTTQTTSNVGWCIRSRSRSASTMTDLRASSLSSSAAGDGRSLNSVPSASPVAKKKEEEEMTETDITTDPSTFREAEVLGLRLMQEGDYEGALMAFRNGMSLPGSRTDIVRTKTVMGPSPVGGASGGTEGRLERTLDEFETQAAHYNMACAHSRLGKVSESIANLRKSFDAGFDNYPTVRSDPDLASIRDDDDVFEDFMSGYDKKGKGGGGRLFGFLG